MKLASTRRDGKYVLYRLADHSVADFWVALHSQAEERLFELQVALASIVEEDGLEELDRGVHFESHHSIEELPMKPQTSLIRTIASVFLIGGFTGCAASQAQQPRPDGTAASAPMAMMGPDMTAMCDMHQKMMSAKTPQERKQLMAEHMKSMPPEMRQKQVEIMKEHMAMMQEQMQMMQQMMQQQTPTSSK